MNELDMTWQLNDTPTAERFNQAYQELLRGRSENEFTTGPPLRKQVAALADAVSEGTPLLTRLDLSLNHSSLLGFARELEGFLFSHASECFHDTVSSLVSPSGPANPIPTFAERVLKGDGAYITSLSEAHDIDVDILSFFGVYLVRPIRRLARQALETHFAVDNWRFGYCPVCGLWPRMSRLEPKVGRRVLWCIGCDGEWSFPRMSCPFCFENDQQKLGYLTVEGWDAYRIYTCESCRRYLKSHDERKAGVKAVFNLDIGYLITSLLDDAATREGYVRDFVGFAAFEGSPDEAAKTYKERALDNW